MSQSNYHHGSLPVTLLTIAEEILERDGVAGLSLRAAARAAGVSHAAPMHHFGDLTGLHSELAAVGFQRFAETLTEAAKAAGEDVRNRMIAMGTAYVAFARRHTALFQLMFGNAKLDRSRPTLRAAMDAAMTALQSAARARAPAGDPLVEGIARWSLVHGFAMLLIDGRMPPGRDPDELLAAVLQWPRPAGNE